MRPFWLIAEIGSTEAWVGGLGGLGVIVAGGWIISKRTAQIDERNDRISDAFMKLAFEREARMSAERDKAQAELLALHLKIALEREQRGVPDDG